MSLQTLSSTEFPLLSRLRSFCFPGGEESARRIRVVRTTQQGEMRMSPHARWIPFTAEEFIDATRSRFRWEARLDPGKIGSPTVVDAYEQGHGRLAVKLGGILPVRKVAGPDADRGEIQRYLSAIAYCPPILLNHLTLEWTSIGQRTFRLGDSQDATGATVDLELSDDDSPRAVRALRPRMVGKHAVLTPWTGTASNFREYEGLRVATHLEVEWELPEGSFSYFQEEITSFEIVR